MKKLHKLLLIFVLVFGIFAISTSYVSAEEVIPEEEIEIPIIEEEIPLEPSELAKWFDENVIQIIVGTSAGFALFTAGIWFMVAWLKKKTKEMNDERKATDKTINTYASENKDTLETIKRIIVALQETQKELHLAREENKLTRETFIELKNETTTTKEMLRIGLSNDKDLVRLGVAEEINKIAKKGV